jgi:hypothetical protein
MFDFEKRVYKNFRNKQIYDECCGDGVRREYVITTNAITFTHMKGCGRAILAAFLKGSGWTLAFTEQKDAKHMILLWNGEHGKQNVLGAIGG